MPVESAQYINTLQPDWPLGTDPESAGDDHLRMVKQVLQNTFPNIGGAVTTTHGHINDLNGIVYHPASDDTDLDTNYFDVRTPDGSTQALLRVKIPALSELDKDNSLAITWSTIQNLIYPVNSIIMTANNVNPAQTLGFGTWVAMTGYIAGAGATTDSQGMSQTITAGYDGGYWRVQEQHIAAVTKSFTTSSNGNHHHTTPFGGSVQSGDADYGVPRSDKGTANTSDAGNHNHTGSISIGSGSVTSGTRFRNPTQGVYVWKRTA